MSKNYVADIWNAHINIDKTVTMWCPKCGISEEFLIHTLVRNKPGQTGKAIDNNSVSVSVGCKANCLACGTRMIDMDTKFLEICEKLRNLGVKILEVNSAYFVPHFTGIPDGKKPDTYCSGANITIAFNNNKNLLPDALYFTYDESEDAIDFMTIEIEEDQDLCGITISSTFDLTEGKCKYGFVNKEAVGGDEKLKLYSNISDDRLLSFLVDFEENIIEED